MISRSKKGFTIIEVVIVLVIGAIIMLMVFLVVPALQRSQRDARRQSDARRFLSASEQWATNHNGNYPADADQVQQVIDDYIKDTFADPQGGNNENGDYNVSIQVGQPTSMGNMYYDNEAKCVDNVSESESGSTSKVAVVVFQENGKSFCVGN